MNVTNGSLLFGRRIEFFSHDSDEEWGYKVPQRDSFAVIHPKDEQAGEKYPLYVVFHSAGHDLYSTVVCITHNGDHDIYHTPDNSFALILDCRANSGNDWWWGGASAHGDFGDGRTGPTILPVEKRCIATVEWTRDNFEIDADRIYAVGNSMGGSGALGIAMRRGDIFAAIKANVPAGVRHADDRCILSGERPEGFHIPDPPIIVDYSAQNDDWSDGHEVLYAAAKDRKYALMGFFGPFGHENNNEKIEKFNDLVHAFDIGTVRLNEAYPVFTGASTDDPIPWPRDESRTDSGQVNAFFRWEVIADEADRFEIALRLLRQDEWESRVVFPAESTANVSLRRLQQFRLAPGERFTWEYGGASGEGAADAEGVPTVGDITIKRDASVLTLRKVR